MSFEDFREAVRLHEAGQLEEAEPLYRAVLARFPTEPGSLHNLALIHKARGDYEAALGFWRTAVAHNPGQPHVHTAMGKVQATLGRLEDALQAFDAALEIRPEDVDTLNSRGLALVQLGRAQAALTSYDQAIAIQPDDGLAQINRAHLLAGLERTEEAIAGYERGLRSVPGDVKALGALVGARLQICDWSDYEAGNRLAERLVGAGIEARAPVSFLAHCGDPAAQQACAEVHLKALFPVRPEALWTGEAYAHRKIRLAYVSSDFRDHAVAQLIAGLFEHHDRSRFEVAAYALGPRVDDPMRRRIAAAIGDFHDVADLSDLEAARMIRAAETDIAVDLNGFTASSRPGIFARRCAPLQINYLGYPGTLGGGLMDYILADPQVIPAGSEGFYGEQVIRLPGSYQVNDRDRPIAAPTPSRAEAGLPPEGLVFACFNASYKITPSVFDVWMRLLQRLPGSVLWLFRTTDAAVRNLRKAAERRGVSADRLVFAGRIASADHLARHRLADLFLDTLPYNAHTTASDALWAGLPLVTCAGRSFASRVAASLLTAVGLPELVTDSLEAYEALAYDLATRPERLAALKAKLAAQRDTAPLFDTALTCRHIEAALTAAWERQRRDEAPAGFDVAP
ncbi:MAG: tetratricopeptide repeat protein [Phenylobacterium sp.]